MQLRRRLGDPGGFSRLAGAVLSFVLLTGCIVASPHPETRAVAREYFEAFEKLDVGQLSSYYTEESVLRDRTAPDPITARGREDIVEYLNAEKEKTSSFILRADATFARRFAPHDIVAIEGVYRWQTEEALYFGNCVLLLTFQKSADGGFFVAEHDQYFDYRTHPGAPFVPTALYLLGTGLWTIVMLWVVVRSFRVKSFGMPAIGSTALFAVSVISGFAGPWQDPILFYPSDSALRVWMWRGWVVETGLLLLQYFLYCKRGNRDRMVAAALVPFWGITIWTFINFYEDYYINQITALLVLVMACGYLYYEIYRPGEVRGMTPLAAWGLVVATVLASFPPLVYHPENAFPFQHHGYHFMFWIYGITTVVLAVWAIRLTRRHRASSASRSD